MIKHIVLWKLKEEALGRGWRENAQLMKEKLESLNGRIPGMIRMEVGIDYSRAESSYDVALYSEFVSRDAQEGYQVHPSHQEVVGFIREVRDLRVVVDYEDGVPV